MTVCGQCPALGWCSTVARYLEDLATSRCWESEASHLAQQALGAAECSRRVLRVAHLHARQRQRQVMLRAGSHQGTVPVAPCAVPVPRRRLCRMAARMPPPVQARHLLESMSTEVSRHLLRSICEVLRKHTFNSQVAASQATHRQNYLSEVVSVGLAP